MVPVTDRIRKIYGCPACILATWQWVSGVIQSLNLSVSIIYLSSGGKPGDKLGYYYMY